MESMKMYTLYHTALRNIGLYTSISLAILAGSRFYKYNSNRKNNQLFLLILSLLFILYSLTINSFLIYDFRNHFKYHEILDKWLLLTKIILFFNLFFTSYIIILIMKVLHLW